MAASNTTEAMRECVDHKIVGVLVGALPRGNREISSRCRTFVLDDGTGFTFSSSGTFWQESAGDVAWAIEKELKRLKEAQETHEAILAMAGQKEGNADLE